MCVIVVKTSHGTPISMTDYEKMFNSNKDGAGIAYIENGRLKIVKGLMTFAEFKAAYNSVPHLNKSTVICHFRWGTQGSKIKSNTHPFVHNGNVLFHNGVISMTNYNQIERIRNDRTDSEQFLIDHSDNIDEFCKKEHASKFVIVKNNKVYFFGDFTYRDGNYYSNLHWEYSYVRYAAPLTTYNNEYDDDYEDSYTKLRSKYIK
jgi:predicted glutamine amidotransferase